MQEFRFIIWAVLKIWLKMFVKQFSGWISGKISFKRKLHLFLCSLVGSMTSQPRCDGLNVCKYRHHLLSSTHPS